MKTERLEKVCREIRDWIRRRVRYAGASGIAIGVSGGIDSAVCLKLAVEALGATNVYALWLNVSSSVDDWQCAAMAARAAGVRLKERSLNTVFNAMVGEMRFVERMAVANTKPRLRANALRGVANEHNLLVMGTSNAVELAIGYGTKGGDLDADMEPLAMFLKAEVSCMAKHLGVPKSIINRPPSAGLWEGQTDEKELGMTYNVLDREVRRLSRFWPAASDTEAKACLRIQDMNKRSAHKRLTPTFFVRDDEVKRALIVVDVQNDFCPGGALPVPDGAAVVPEINALMRYFPRIHCTADWHPKGHTSFASSHEQAGQPCKVGDVIDIGGVPHKLWPDHCVRETQGARLHDGLWLGRMTRLHRKGVHHARESYSPFFDVNGLVATDLHQMLQIEGVNEVCIVGLALDYCVKTTALHAKDLEYDTYVVLSATRPVNVNPEDATLAITEMGQAGIHVEKTGAYLSGNE